MYSDLGYPMYFVPDAKIDTENLRLLSKSDIKSLIVTLEIEKQLDNCNLDIEDLIGLYCDKDGNVIKNIDGQYFMFRLQINEFKKGYKNSNSDVQQKIEKYLVNEIKSKLNIKDLQLNPSLILSNAKVKIEPDFYSETNRIIGEIHVHLGKLKSAQRHKLSNDILKMLLLEKDRNIVCRKIIVVCSEEEYKELHGASFLAEAIRQFNIEIYFFNLNETDKQQLQDAMLRQDLTKN